MAKKTVEIDVPDNVFVPENYAEEKKVKIRLPRERKDEADVFVSVNNRTWLIKRGEEVEVPECVVEVLRNSEQMREEALLFMDDHVR